MAGWTPPSTWVDGPLTAAELNEQVRDNLLAANPPAVIKGVDESLNLSAVLQNDNELAYAIADTGVFIFDLYLLATSAANAAGDIQVGFTFPTGTLNLWNFGPDVGLASGNVQTGQWGGGASVASGSAFNSYGLSTNTIGIHLHGSFVATATGTLQFQWAQAASNGNNTTVKAGSHLIVVQKS